MMGLLAYMALFNMLDETDGSHSSGEEEEGDTCDESDESYDSSEEEEDDTCDEADESYDSSEEEEEETYDEAGQILLNACQSGKLALVKKLITKENVNSIINGETPLIAACRLNRLNVVKYLVKTGANVLKPGNVYHPLSAACYRGTITLVKFLLEKGADKSINMSGDGNLMPLHQACANRKDRNGEIVRLLLNAGATVDARGFNGITPLMIAVTHQSGCGTKKPLPKQIEVLLEAGADLYARRTDGEYPLKLADQSPDTFRFLVENGADVDTFSADEPLYESAHLTVGSLEVLLEYNAGVDIRCRNQNCRRDVLVCCYLQYRNERSRAYIKRFEEHFIRMDVAGLYYGKGILIIFLLVDSLCCYKGRRRDLFREKCQAELAKMSTQTIGNTGATYLDVLYQRRWALLRVEALPLKTCQANFRIYGGLIRSRFLTGRVKLPLVDKCMGFFELTDLPHLPSLCVAEILSYLSVRDLREVVAAHTPQKGKEDVMSDLSDLKQGASADGASTSKEVEPLPIADLRSGLKRQLSDGDLNSSEPKRSGMDIVRAVSIPGHSAIVGLNSSIPKPSSSE